MTFEIDFFLDFYFYKNSFRILLFFSEEFNLPAKNVERKKLFQKEKTFPTREIFTIYYENVKVFAKSLLSNDAIIIAPMAAACILSSPSSQFPPTHRIFLRFKWSVDASKCFLCCKVQTNVVWKMIVDNFRGTFC